MSIAPVAAGFAARAGFTPVVGLIVKRPPPGDELRTATEIIGLGMPTVTEGLFNCTDPVIETTPTTGGITPASFVKSSTRRLVMRRIRAPSDASMGTLKNVTALGTFGLNCPRITLG